MARFYSILGITPSIIALLMPPTRYWLRTLSLDTVDNKLLNFREMSVSHDGILFALLLLRLGSTGCHDLVAPSVYLTKSITKKLQHNFTKMRGEGRRPFGTFPKIHPIW